MVLAERPALFSEAQKYLAKKFGTIQVRVTVEGKENRFPEIWVQHPVLFRGVMDTAMFANAETVTWVFGGEVRLRCPGYTVVFGGIEHPEGVDRAWVGPIDACNLAQAVCKELEPLNDAQFGILKDTASRLLKMLMRESGEEPEQPGVSVSKTLKDQFERENEDA